MSYAIIRNTNYKIGQLPYIYRHNERKNTNYSNNDISKKNSIKNYSLKKCTNSYQKAFNLIKEKYNLKGQIKKVSNVMCELIITSDKDFFETIGEQETRRYFETAYKFVANYQNLGEEFIISAKVHLDEKTPHLHIVFIPVIHTTNKKGNEINKIACSEFWKGRDSYKILQNKFYKYITDNGFDLERGKSRNVKHLSVEEYKKVTNYEAIKYELQNEYIPKIDNSNMQLVIAQNKKLQLYNKKLKTYLAQTVTTIEKIKSIEQDNKNLIQENLRLSNENKFLNNYINRAYEYISILINIPKARIKNMLDNFFKEFNNK